MSRLGNSGDDGLPQCMYEDPIGPANAVFNVPKEIMAAVKAPIPDRKELFTTAPSG